MATDDQMERASEVVKHTVQCCLDHNVPFTVRSGGHNNAGASVMSSKLTIDVRGLNRIAPTFDIANPDVTNCDDFNLVSPGTVRVGVGATAGQSVSVSYN